MTEQTGEDLLPQLALNQLRPWFSITILECVVEDGDSAFAAFVKYLRKAAGDKGRSLTAELTAEIQIGGPDDNSQDDSSTMLADLGFDRLYGVARRRSQVPAWAIRDSSFIDTINELTLALRRGRLVAIRSDINGHNKPLAMG